MSAFARRPNGAPTKAYTIRINPDVLLKVEDFARKNAQTANLAFEELLTTALSIENETEVINNAEENSANSE